MSRDFFCVAYIFGALTQLDVRKDINGTKKERTAVIVISCGCC